MDSMCVGNNIDWDLVSFRFADIAFLLSLEQREPIQIVRQGDCYNAVTKKGPLYTEDIRKEVAIWLSGLRLEEVDILYVHGVGLGYHYEALKPWLREKKERVVVFVEEDLLVLQALFSLPLGLDLLKDSQVHISYLPDSSSWDIVFDTCVQWFISDKVDLVAISSYKYGQERNLKKRKLSLLRKATLVYVGMTEFIQYHLLLENIACNILRLPESFHANRLKGACEGIPAIICGAGATLNEAISLLKSLENKAIVIAGGSTITALSHHGIIPHIAIALDPNEEEYTRLKSNSAFEMPFIYSSRLDKDVFSCMNVKPGYLYSETGGVFEAWMHEQLGIGHDSLGPELGMEALSVTTLAVPLACFLGCGPILFCGVDLSYQKKQRYAPGVLSSSQVFLEELKQEQRAMEQQVSKKNAQGKKVDTLVKWVMEAACIGSYAKKQKQLCFFNASEKGLSIPNVPPLALEEFISLYCEQEYDLRGLLHAQGEMSRFLPKLETEVKKTFSSFVESMKRCIGLLSLMLEELEKKLEESSGSLESGKMSLLLMDLEQEEAYRACLQYAFFGYSKILERAYPAIEGLDQREDRRYALEKKRQLWRECQRVAKASLALFIELKLVAQCA